LSPKVVGEQYTHVGEGDKARGNARRARSAGGTVGSMGNIGLGVVFAPAVVVAMGVGCGSSNSGTKSQDAGGEARIAAGGEASTPPPVAAGGEASTAPPDVDAGAVSLPAAVCTAPIQAADVSNPTTVVGTGTAASCTEAALSAALTKGGVVTFDCGSTGATITVTQTIELPTGIDTVIDGGGIVTIDGGGSVRILDWNSPNYRANMHKLTLQHITFAHGHATGTMSYRGGAGALLVRLLRRRRRRPADARRRPQRHRRHLRRQLGREARPRRGRRRHLPERGARWRRGGLDLPQQLGSNSGAIGSLNSDLDVYNSTSRATRRSASAPTATTPRSAAS
jgi:hypothetical protein